MLNNKVFSISLLVVTVLLGCNESSDSSEQTEQESAILPKLSTKQALGERLFSDVNLSFNRSQSCGTCHDPQHGFIDSRLDKNNQVSAVSLGDDGIALGDRNSPTALYASFSPEFHLGERVRYNTGLANYQGALGGQFHDGRESNLEGQAKQPPLNPVEMAMPSIATVIERVAENSDYVAAFEYLFGGSVLEDELRFYDAFAETIAAFERSDAVAPFSAKYDQYLRGEYTYPEQSKAAQGMALFFSDQANCATCHQLEANGSQFETFTGYEYHNLGVPINQSVRAINGTPPNRIDIGLLGHPQINDQQQVGKFKTPTLRNVAVTAPYMHNGSFRKLTTVIKFHERLKPDSPHTINPETGVEWLAPEVEQTIAVSELTHGAPLSEVDIENLVCFLVTLTDAEYQVLAAQVATNCED